MSHLGDREKNSNPRIVYDILYAFDLSEFEMMMEKTTHL